MILLQPRPFFRSPRLIPTLDLSIFVWRLALPAAFLLFGALLVGWRQAPRPSRGLPALASLAMLGMVFVMLQFPNHLMDRLDWADDRVALTGFEAPRRHLGRRYLPQYKGVPVECTTPDARRVSYRDLRNGVEARARYVRVPQGPVGLVD